MPLRLVSRCEPRDPDGCWHAELGHSAEDVACDL
jgi:hypothetical protein